jgi:hypothetical protein
VTYGISRGRTTQAAFAVSATATGFALDGGGLSEAVNFAIFCRGGIGGARCHKGGALPVDEAQERAWKQVDERTAPYAVCRLISLYDERAGSAADPIA